jgi:hypothetical protein
MPKRGYEKGTFDLMAPDFIGLTLEEAAKLASCKPSSLLARFENGGYRIKYEVQSTASTDRNQRIIEGIRLPGRTNFLENRNKFGDGVTVFKFSNDEYRKKANTFHPPRRRLSNY